MRSPANLDVKALAVFDGIRQPAQLRREFRDAVVLLKITLRSGVGIDVPCLSAFAAGLLALRPALRLLSFDGFAYADKVLLVIRILDTAHQAVGPLDQHASMAAVGTRAGWLIVLTGGHAQDCGWPLDCHRNGRSNQI